MQLVLIMMPFQLTANYENEYQNSLFVYVGLIFKS